MSAPQLPDAAHMLTAAMAQAYLDDQSAVDLDLIERVAPEAARIIAAYPYGISFDSWRTLTDEAVLPFGERSCTLHLSAVTSLDGLSAEALRALGRGDLILGGLERISPEQLRAVAAGNGYLFLGAITSIDDEQIDILGQHTGFLSLDGITELSATAASTLVGTRSGLSLDGLTRVDDAMAEALGRVNGTTLSLNGLTTLSPRQAAHLARCTGSLSLDGLIDLSSEVAAALATHEGQLSLGGVVHLTDGAAAALAQHRGELLLAGVSAASASLRALLPHRGAFGLEGLTAVPVPLHAELLAVRSAENDRNDGTTEEDFVWLGEEGGLSQGTVSITTTSTGAPAVPVNLLAIAHHLHVGATTSVTPRELLGWFGAQRRGKKVTETINRAIDALKAEGFSGVESLTALLEAEDLDEVLVIPSTGPIGQQAWIDALRPAMTRLGYHLVDGGERSARFQSAMRTGRRRTLTIARVAEDPCIVRASTTVALPDEDAALAHAVAFTARINRQAFVGRMQVDLTARTVRYDVLGAVRIVSDLRTADAAEGVLPRLLSFVEAADLLMHRALLDAPVHDPPERAVEAVELDAAAAGAAAAVEGTSVRVTKTITLGHRPWDPDADEEEPPQVSPELVGLVTRLNADASCAKVYLWRDTQEREYVNAEVAPIVTDGQIVSKVARWVEGEADATLAVVRSAMHDDGRLPPRLDSVDAVLASLEAEGDEAEEELDAEDADAADPEIGATTLEAPSHPRMEEVRALLGQTAPEAVRQGLALVAALHDRALWAAIAAGVSLRRSGVIRIPYTSEIYRTVKNPVLRDEVALWALCRTGRFDDVEQLSLTSRHLEDLEALRGLPSLRTLAVTFCPKLTNLDAVRGLPALEALELNYSAPLSDEQLLPASTITVRVRRSGDAETVFEDLVESGPFFQRLAAHRVIRRAFDGRMMREMQYWPAAKTSLEQKGWVLPAKPNDPKLLEAERLPVFVVDVHHLRGEDSSAFDEHAAAAVADAVDCFPPTKQFLGRGHFFDFLFIDVAQRLVVGMGLGRKCRSFREASIDGAAFTDAQWKPPEALANRIAASVANAPYDLLGLMSREFDRLSSSIEEQNYLPSRGELEDRLSGESDDEARQEIEEEITRVDGIAEEIEDNGEIFKTFFPALDLVELNTYDF